MVQPQRRQRSKVIPVDKPYFDLGGGMFTESTALNWPDGASYEEENLEILTDRSRRRRRGINFEDQPTPFSFVSDYAPGDSVQTYKWSDVASDPTLTFIVVQLGNELHFYSDGFTLSDKKLEYRIDLTSFVLENTGATEVQITEPVSLSSGRGNLIVCSNQLKPFYVEYQPSTNTFVPQEILIQVREFTDINDGIGLWEYPDHAAGDPFNEDCPVSHEYNLRNRGWIFNDENEGAWKYAEDKGQWPAKGQIPYYGYVAQNIESGVPSQSAGWLDLTHYKEWDSNRLDTEVFGNSDTPKGSLIIDPFDNTIPDGVSAQTVRKLRPGDQYGFFQLFYTSAVTLPYYNPATDKVRITVKLNEDHGASVGDDVTIENFRFLYQRTVPTGTGISDNQYNVIGKKTFEIVAVEASDRIAIEVELVVNGRNQSKDFSNGKELWYPQGVRFYFQRQFRNTEAEITNSRPSAVAWYAGRVFYAGVNSSRWQDTIFFSRVVTQPRQYGWCYQAADPTHPQLNALEADDGGTIQIPNMGRVIHMEPMDASLIVFTTSGVWEVLGANYFSATDIRVRQITSAEAISNIGITSIDQGLVYTSHRGVYLLSRQGETGLVGAQSLTEATIQTYWNELSYNQQRKAQLSYDESKQRVYILHDAEHDLNEFRYNRCLVLDLRIGSFFKYTFSGEPDCFICAMHSTSQSSQPDEFQKMKFFILENSGGKLRVADMSQKTFTDFCGSEKVPYIILGYDNLGDFARQRAAPIIHTYLKNTETGAGAFSIRGEQEVTLSPRWDFSKDPATGDFGRPMPVSKPRRPYAPDGTSGSYSGGYDVIVSRNKVRGWGKVLQLKYEGSPGKDMHILGFSIHYNILGVL